MATRGGGGLWWVVGWWPWAEDAEGRVNLEDRWEMDLAIDGSCLSERWIKNYAGLITGCP